VNDLRRLAVLGLLSAGLFGLLLSPGPAPGGGEGDKDKVVSTTDLAKEYATDAAAFNRGYKGKTIVVEGVVEDAAVRDLLSKDKHGKKRWVMLRGYHKPGEPVSHQVRCEYAPDFEDLRIGYKVRVRGTCQGHRETLYAAELRDCKLVKVFADDYPPGKAVRADLKKLQGRWKVVSAEAGGKKLAVQAGGIEGFDFDGQQVAVNTGKGFAIWGLVLDPAKEPRAMDLVNADGRKIPLIYGFEGEQLRVALPGTSKQGFQRPANFDSTKNRALVLTAERQK
jgi:uncharacterized protein (TIGR03067 family)